MATTPVTPATKIALWIFAAASLLMAGLAFVTTSQTSLALLAIAMLISFVVNKLITVDTPKGIIILNFGIYLTARAALFAAFFAIVRLALISF